MVQPIRLSRKITRLNDTRCLLAERSLRPSLGHDLASELRRQRLSDACGIRDRALLDRLLASQFCEQTIGALGLAPVALTAWGSGEVTAREFRTSIDAIYSSSLSGQTPAIKRFRTWLKRRPTRELWGLWEEFVAAQLATDPPRQSAEDGERIYQQCRQVAMASGGLLGIGQVCSAEKRVLEAVRKAYRLDQSR